MSAWVLEKKSIENLAETIAYAANHGTMFFKAYEIRNAFEDCKDYYGDLNEKKLAAALYEMNVSAVNQRYNESDPTDDITFDGFGQSYFGKNYLFSATLQNLCQFAKSLRCFLYQCAEGDIPERETYKVLERFSYELFAHIVDRLPEYDEAKWG